MTLKSACQLLRTVFLEQNKCLPIAIFCPLQRGARRNFYVHHTLRYISTGSKKASQTTTGTTSTARNVKEPRSQAKAWNEAASVMIVAPMNNSEPYSLGYLLVERSTTGRVMPGNWVYPGGNADPSDSDTKWVELFKDIQNIDILQERILCDSAHVPEIYASNNGTLIPKEVSLRITAVREAFEEAGVLLCRPRNLQPEKHLCNGMLHYEFPELEDKKQVQTWQKRVRKNGHDFIELCRELDCSPDIHALHDWSNWLTPAIFKPKSRFDTMMYMIILPRMVRILIDGNEAVSAQWISPDRVMADHAKGQIRLMPPQIYEFSRLRACRTIGDLQKRLKIRKERGIERFCPVVKNVNDGTLFLLPGDDLYPDPPNYIELDAHSLEEVPETIAQLTKSSVNLHRGIANSDRVITSYEINVERYGHIY